MGREPEKNENPYYSPKIVWLLAILVGVAIIVVGLTVLSEEKPPPLIGSGNDSLKTDSMESPDDQTALTASTESIDSASILEDWNNLERGLENARQLKSYAMVYFTAGECPPCREFENEVLSLIDFQRAISMPVVPVVIDADSREIIEYGGRQIRESSAADFFGISGFPSLLFYHGGQDKFLFGLSGKKSYEQVNRALEYLEKQLYLDSTINLQEFISDIKS